jgi:hypothetical protein
LRTEPDRQEIATKRHEKAQKRSQPFSCFFVAFVAENDGGFERQASVPVGLREPNTAGRDACRYPGRAHDMHQSLSQADDLVDGETEAFVKRNRASIASVVSWTSEFRDAPGRVHRLGSASIHEYRRHLHPALVCQALRAR